MVVWGAAKGHHTGVGDQVAVASTFPVPSPQILFCTAAPRLPMGGPGSGFLIHPSGLPLCLFSLTLRIHLGFTSQNTLDILSDFDFKEMVGTSKALGSLCSFCPLPRATVKIEKAMNY